ncbi:hypothetical protein RhiirC2_779767 [Rhizophagus irregularis]|uniref:TLDc domain-containing protein n=1 Tax=Rhizophagus irregularis TaxID=588596 RepID=A0A2N1N959_9GLOM|nr:hypothetical protein RhiirC2_779767 [Rhizophagus irregularis]
MFERSISTPLEISFCAAVMKLTQKTSQNYIELLDDNEYYDITVEVGKDPNVKIFLSEYITRGFPNYFKVFLWWYSFVEWTICFKIFQILLAADELFLQELIDYLQKYLIENKSEWMEQHFEFIHRTSFQYNSLLEIQRFCTDFMSKSPEKVFKSLDFTSLPEKSLVQLIKRDDLQMKEIEVWEHVLEWIFSLSSKEFSQKVRPYKKLLRRQIYENLLNSHLDPDIKPIDNILLPRNIRFDGIIDSKIIDLNMASIISRWINKVDVNCNFSYLRESYLPYKFQLLLRGSRDGFTPKRFHELCDGKPYTVTFIKVKGAEEIIGGYDPLKWESSGGWVVTKDSFIFSFNNNDIKNAIISNIEKTNEALYCGSKNGPDFADIILWAHNESTDYTSLVCKKRHHEKSIRDAEGNFTMDDYEVFQILKR